MKILQIVEYRCRETISILRVLLELALKGKLRGLVVLYRDEDGDEHTVCTGVFKRNPQKAAGASLRMSLNLMRANGEIE